MKEMRLRERKEKKKEGKKVGEKEEKDRWDELEIPRPNAKTHLYMFHKVNASPFSFSTKFSLTLSFSHFCTLFMGFRENDDFELFFLNLKFLCWGLVLQSIRNYYWCVYC